MVEISDGAELVLRSFDEVRAKAEVVAIVFAASSVLRNIRSCPRLLC